MNNNSNSEAEPQFDNTSEPETAGDITHASRQLAPYLAVANRVVELSLQGRLQQWNPEPDEPASLVLRQVYGQGGLDAIDNFLAKVNACLAIRGVRYSFFPGAATDGRADREPEFLVLTSRDQHKDTQVSHHWFQLA